MTSLRFARIWRWLGLCAASAVWLCSCGGVDPVDLATTYLASDVDQQIQLFVDDAVYVAVDGIAYSGRDRIHARLKQAFDQNSVGEVLDPPHADGDHVVWTRVTYSKLVPGVASRLQQSMRPEGSKIGRLVTKTM